MSKKQSNPLTVMQTDPFDSSSGWGDFAFMLGILGLVMSICLFFAAFYGVADEGKFFSALGALFMGSIQLLVIGHLMKILANIRWFTYKTSEKSSSGTIDHSLFSGVIDELKKISEQNKAQSEALTKSIDEFSDKTEKTNAYLYHILSNMK